MTTTAPQIQVTIPSALRSLYGLERKQGSELELPGRNVRELLAELRQNYPQIHVRICDEQGDPRPHINVFVNDDHIRVLDGIDTPLRDGDKLTILPAVSGG